MYCPSCGKENSEKQRFCTSCGLKLQTVSRVLSRLPEAWPVEESGEVSSFDPKGWIAPLVYGSVIIVFGVIIAVIGNQVLHDKTVTDIGTVLALLGVGLIGLKGVLLTVSSHQPAHHSGSPATRAAPPSDLNTSPVALLTPEPASITEHTTRTLDTSPQRRETGSGDHGDVI
jgi:hypothetical protein